MMHRDYTKELGLPSHVPVLSPLTSCVALTVIAVAMGFTVVHMVATRPVHAKAPQVVANAKP
jgi:hypothetical protein